MWNWRRCWLGAAVGTQAAGGGGLTSVCPCPPPSFGTTVPQFLNHGGRMVGPATWVCFLGVGRAPQMWPVGVSLALGLLREEGSHRAPAGHDVAARARQCAAMHRAPLSLMARSQGSWGWTSLPPPASWLLTLSLTSGFSVTSGTEALAGPLGAHLVGVHICPRGTAASLTAAAHWVLGAQPRSLPDCSLSAGCRTGASAGRCWGSW